MHETTMSNAGGHVCSGDPIRPALVSSQGDDGGTPVLLKAVYYAAPDSSNDSSDDSSDSLNSADDYDVLAEVVTRGGVMTFTAKCCCCNRREITALFGDRAKAMDAGESLKVTRNAEVEILTLEKALGEHASRDGVITPDCGENR
jgi:hypothetical protein